MFVIVLGSRTCTLYINDMISKEFEEIVFVLEKAKKRTRSDTVNITNSSARCSICDSPAAHVRCLIKKLFAPTVSAY